MNEPTTRERIEVLELQRRMAEDIHRIRELMEESRGWRTWLRDVMRYAAGILKTDDPKS